VTSSVGRGRRLVVLLVVAAAAAGCTGGGEPAPAAAGPASVPAPSTTLRWTTCALPAGPGAVVRAVAPGGDGVPWTAVGQEAGKDDIRPAVWTSADGCGWRRVPVHAVTPDGERTGFTAVVRRRRLVVALGGSSSKVHGNTRPTLWRASGPAPLREVELLRELFGGESGISVADLTVVPDAVLAVGAYITPSKWVAVQLWRTADGADWRRPPPAGGLVSSRTEQLLPRDLAAGPAGSVVVGTAFQLRGGARDGFDSAAWYAGADSRVWRRADLGGTGLAGQGDQRLLTATWVPDGYVAVAAVAGSDGFGLRSAVSPDGRSWSAGGELPLDRALPAGDLPAAAITPGPAGSGAVASTVADGRPALWRSPDGRAWQPETVPSGHAKATGLVLAGSADRLVLVVQTPAGPRTYLAR